MTLQFKKATRSLSRLRLAISGASGSGKTYSALLLAKGLGGKIAVVDTERGSASLYAGLDGMPDFDVLDLGAPFAPESYIEAIHAAESAGYDVLIIDSITHEWSGVGGCLELNEKIAQTKYRGNSWSAWNETTPRHRAFVDSMVQSKCHIIATMRSKTDTIQTENDKGRKVVQKIGLKPEQRDGMDYEFTVVFDLQTESHYATVSKDRSALFRDPIIITEDTGKRLKAWLESATDPEAEKVKALAAELAEKGAPEAAKGTAAYREFFKTFFPKDYWKALGATDAHKALLAQAEAADKAAEAAKNAANAAQDDGTVDSTSAVPKAKENAANATQQEVA